MAEHVPETVGPISYRVPKPGGGTVKMVRTWTQRQATKIIADALAIVEELDPPDDLRQAVFGVALNLGGQMAPEDSGVTIPKLDAIGRN